MNLKSIFCCSFCRDEEKDDNERIDSETERLIPSEEADVIDGEIGKNNDNTIPANNNNDDNDDEKLIIKIEKKNGLENDELKNDDEYDDQSLQSHSDMEDGEDDGDEELLPLHDDPLLDVDVNNQMRKNQRLHQYSFDCPNAEFEGPDNSFLNDERLGYDEHDRSNIEVDFNRDIYTFGRGIEDQQFSQLDKQSTLSAKHSSGLISSKIDSVTSFEEDIQIHLADGVDDEHSVIDKILNEFRCNIVPFPSMRNENSESDEGLSKDRTVYYVERIQKHNSSIVHLLANEEDKLNIQSTKDRDNTNETLIAFLKSTPSTFVQFVEETENILKENPFTLTILPTDHLVVENPFKDLII
ncbi:hypothetical protein SNEBB_008319 [Seison nebaliae]|nr:hypothetical protein SNEBB_008319 [Seison nebaliae]